MKQITVTPLEDRIVNINDFTLQFFNLLKNNERFMIEVNDGVALETLKIGNQNWLEYIKEACRNFGFQEEHIIISTCNLIQSKEVWPNIKIRDTSNLMFNHSKNFLVEGNDKDINKTFGLFVGGSRWHRLWFASYLDSKYRNKTIITYWQHHFNSTQPANLHFDDLLLEMHNSNDKEVYDRLVRLMKQLPLHLDSEQRKDNHNTGYINFDHAYDSLIPAYRSIFLDVVCETWHRGHCFCPTEKIFRPAALMTPFIVYGPKNYLKNLRSIGFKTFNNFWDEGYDSFEGYTRIKKMQLVVDEIAKLDIDQLKKIHNEMSSSLINNQQVIESHTDEKLKKIFNF